MLDVEGRDPKMKQREGKEIAAHMKRTKDMSIYELCRHCGSDEIDKFADTIEEFDEYLSLEGEDISAKQTTKYFIVRRMMERGHPRYTR